MLPTGDDLSIYEWLFGLAAAAIFTAVSMIQWGRRVIIAALLLLGASLFMLGGTWPLVKDYYPSFHQTLGDMSTDPTAWLSLVLFCAAIGLWNKKIPSLTPEMAKQIDLYAEDKARSAVELSLIDFYKPNTLMSALRIQLGGGKRFERFQINKQSILCLKDIYVALHNEGNGFLTSCKLNIRSSMPAPKTGNIPNVFDFDFGLAAKEYKFIPLISFIEKYEGEPTEFHDEIKVRTSQKASFWNNSVSFDRVSRQNPIFFTLEASAEECGVVEMHCRMWVDPDRILKIEEV